MIGAVTAAPGRDAVTTQSAMAAPALSTSRAASVLTAPTDAADVQGRPNPVASVAPNLGITVLTFHNASGAVVATAPTQAQLDAYLLYGDPADAKPKPGATSPADGSDSQGVALLA